MKNTCRIHPPQGGEGSKMEAVNGGGVEIGHLCVQEGRKSVRHRHREGLRGAEMVGPRCQQGLDRCQIQLILVQSQRSSFSNQSLTETRSVKKNIIVHHETRGVVWAFSRER